MRLYLWFSQLLPPHLRLEDLDELLEWQPAREEDDDAEDIVQQQHTQQQLQQLPQQSGHANQTTQHLAEESTQQRVPTAAVGR